MCCWQFVWEIQITYIEAEKSCSWAVLLTIRKEIWIPYIEADGLFGAKLVIMKLRTRVAKRCCWQDLREFQIPYIEVNKSCSWAVLLTTRAGYLNSIYWSWEAVWLQMSYYAAEKSCS